MKRIGLLFILLALCAAPALATSYTWDGGGGANQNWMLTANWDPESPVPNYASGSGDTFLIGSGSTAQTAGGIFYAQLTVEGTLNVNDNWAGAQNLVLNGGTLGDVAAGTMQLYNSAGSIKINDADPGVGVTTSYLNVSNAAGTLYVQSRLDAGTGGSGNLEKTGSGLLILNGNLTAGTWAGTMAITGGRVRLENNTTTLASGSLEVDADELDISNFYSGTVKIKSGGIATNTSNAGRVSTLRLQGGTLQGDGNNNIGDGGSTSKIYVDNDSILKGKTLNQSLLIYAQLNGAGGLNVTGPGWVQLNNNLAGNTYTGTITIADGGTLRMGNRLGLSGGTINVENATGLMYVGDGFSSGTVNVKTNGILDNDNNNVPVLNLHLQGGTLRGASNWNLGDGGTTSKITVDSASTIQGKTLNESMQIYAQLNGAGNLNITGPGRIQLSNNLAGNTYSGIISIADGATLRMGDRRGLSGGTINVENATGLMQVGDGFTSGTVNVKTSGILDNDNNSTPVSNLHLQGGTLRGASNWNLGDGGTTSKIYVDNASTLQGKTLNEHMYISAQLNGSAGLNITGPGWVDLNNGVTGNTYSGTITVASNGHLRMNNSSGLSGGTITLDGTSGQFQLGNGFINGTVDVNTGGVAQADNSGGTTPAYALRLDGGNLQGVVNGAYVGDNTANSNIYVDSASTISTSAAVASGNWLYIRSKLQGTKDLTINNATSGAGVQLGYNASAATYSGTITVDSGSKLQMENSYGLSGGNVSLSNPTGVFILNAGFLNGTVTANTGGVVQANNTSNTPNVALHLNGGTLQGIANNAVAGDNTANSKIYVDAASTLSTSSLVASGNWLYIRSRLNGSGNLVINDATSGAGVQLGYNASAATYSGTITVDSGSKLQMENSYGLSGGNVSLSNPTGVFILNAGFLNGTVTANTGGVVQANNTSNTPNVALHLNGGTLQGIANNAVAGDNTANSKIYVDAASTLSTSSLVASGNWLILHSQLYGSGNLVINDATSGAGVELGYTTLNTNYSGTITVDSGSKLRMENSNGLGGGKISLSNPTGIFQLGGGFANGSVWVNTGGVAETDVNSASIAKELRLKSGTLRSLDSTSDYQWGDNTANSNIYVDNDSTIQATRSGYTLTLNAKMNGSANVVKTGAGYLAFNSIANNAATYSGNWDIQAGYLRLSNPTGGTWKGENLGSGASVNIASGAYLLLNDSSTNRWDITKTFTGNGTIKFDQVDDRIVVTRNAANTFGGISPGNSVGTLNLSWTAPNTNSQLDFAKNVSGDRPVWYVEAVDATTYDKVVSNGYLSTNLANAKLVVDPTKPIADALTIYQGIASQNLSTQAFGEVSWMYDTTGTVNYNTNGTITLTNILPVLWNTASGSWNVTGNWDRLLPTSNTMAGVWNGGVSEVNTAQNVLNLTVQNADSTVNIVAAGSLNAGRSIEVRSGGTMSVDGALTTPLVNSTGTTNLNGGATGAITTLNVSDGTTTIKTGSGFGYTNVNVIGGASAGGNMAVDDATVALTAMVVGTTDQTRATALITDSTVTAGSVAVHRSNNALTPSTLTVGSGGQLILANTAAYIADSGSYDTGRYVLASGGKIRFTSSIDLATFQAQTEWTGGVLVVDGTLDNYNNRNLTAGQVVDFGATGDLQAGSSNRLYLRGGEVRFADGYVRDQRLQMTEDLGTIVVSGGALSSMPGTISASVTLSGALATWATGNATMGQGTVLTLADGAKATVGSGKFLNVDQIAFGGTGGTVELANGYLIHGAAELVMGAGALITGSGQVLVGASGIDLGSLGDEGSLLGTGAGLVVYGDIRGNGSLVNTTVYGNISVGHSPGEITMGGTTLSGSSVLAMEIGGTDAGLYDQVLLPGNLNLQSGATLDVAWYNGFEGTMGDSFQLFSLTGGSISGVFALNLPTFADPGLSWDTSDLYSSGTISVVPEPATMALLAVGGVLVLMRRRRRQ